MSSRKRWPTAPSAFILAPEGTLTSIAKRYGALLREASLGEIDSQAVLFDLFEDLGALVYRYDSPNGKHEARAATEDVFVAQPEGKEILFFGGGAREQNGGKLYRGVLKRHVDNLSKEYFSVDWQIASESRRARRRAGRAT